MKYLRKMLMVAGALALAGILGVAIAPKAAHGLVAAAVQVVNTSANPAITEDTSKQVSQIVELFCGTTTGAGCFQFIPDAPVPSTPFTVPTGQTLVVTNIELQTVAGGGIATFSFSYEPAPGTFIFKSWRAVNNGTTAEFSLGSGFGIAGGITVHVGTSVNVNGEFIRGYLTSN